MILRLATTSAKRNDQTGSHYFIELRRANTTLLSCIIPLQGFRESSLDCFDCGDFVRDEAVIARRNNAKARGKTVN
jgi:hypothetical protein